MCTGPIFDAHDIRILVVPGCIGIVAATMLMSVCKGTCIHCSSSIPSLNSSVKTNLV